MSNAPEKKSKAAKRKQRANARLVNFGNKNSELKSALASEINKIKQQSNLPTDIGSIMKLYKEKDTQLMKAMNQLNNLKLSQRISDKAIFDYDRKKLKVPGMGRSEFLEKIKNELGKQGIELPPLSNRQLLQLVALDDWSSILSAALPHILRFGAPYIHKLWEKYIQPYLGGDEGINPIDWTGNMAIGKFAQNLVPGLNVSTLGVTPVYEREANADSVSCMTIKTIIAPEVFKYRYTVTNLQKTAIGSYTSEYTCITSSGGSFITTVQPLACWANGLSYSNSFITHYNASTLDVNAGTTASAPTTTAGPLNTSLGSIDSIKISSFSLEVRPISSLTTAGSFVLAYNNRTSTYDMAGQASMYLSNARLQPYSAAFNNRTNYRNVMVHGGNSAEMELYGTGGGVPNQRFGLIGSGFPANTSVCKIIATIVFEFVPTTSAFPLSVMDFPSSGVLTSQFESAMFARLPVLQCLTMDDANRIATSLPNRPVAYDDLMKILETAVTGITPAGNMFGLAHGGMEGMGLALPNMSFDAVIE